jgi:pimeloyl-ACP methyl ester carboxylesterase
MSDKIRDLLKLTKEEHFVDDKLSQLKCPVLLLWGKEDKLLSSQIPVVLAQKIKNIHASWVEHCAHVLPLEAPATCYREMNKFLKLTCIKNNKFANTILSIGRSYPLHFIESQENLYDY